MFREKHAMPDVFGTSRTVPLTYTPREKVDGRFVNDITRNKHIVVHGSSKQGKTCLRKYHLRDTEHIVVQCTRETNKAGLYEQILKRAGIPAHVTDEKTTRGTLKVRVQLAGSVGIPFVAKGSGEGETEGLGEHARARTEQQFEIDIEDPNDIARVLTAADFKKLVVIEDFHYLDEDVQKSVAVDLKVFHEISELVFIVVGVWLETNRLVMYNGDLSGRVSAIEVDQWSLADMGAVIELGCTLLNIKIVPTVRDAIVATSEGNIGLLQEICYRLCEAANVWHTLDVAVEVGTADEVQGIARQIADSESSRHQNFLSRFAEGLGETQLEMYRWIAYTVIVSDSQDLKRGLRPASILRMIRESHPNGEGIQYANVTQALERVAKVQHKQKIQPLVLDYSANELRAVDAGFLVFLRTHSREELLEIIGLRPPA
jgi:hypothetical protein